MSPLPFYVYAILRPDGTPCYIGKGKGNRLRHNGKYGRNAHLLRIIANAKAAGTPVDRVKLIEDVSEPDALALEAFFIAAIGREAHGGPLVNLTDGGDNGPVGYKHPPELRARHSAIRKGRGLTPEWRAAIAAGMPKTKTVEHIANAANARRGVKNKSGWWATEEGRAKQRANNRGNTGHKYSAEACEKIRRASTRQLASSNARKCVKTSPTWAARNSVRYHQPVAA
jgi:hypothetical protein